MTSNKSPSLSIMPLKIEVDAITLRAWDARSIEQVETRCAALRRNADHLRPWFAWAATDDVSYGKQRELLESWEAQRLLGTDVHYAILIADQPNTLAGALALHTRGTRGRCEIGYWLDADHTHRGIATQAVIAAVQEVWHSTGCNIVELIHDVSNRASAAVAARAGFTHIKRVSAPLEAPGHTGQQDIWRITVPGSYVSGQ